MAIYHCSVKTTSRSNGHTSIARASYRSGVAMTDNRTGLSYDYGKKKGVIHSEIFLGKGWEEEDREKLWNRIEQTETRINSTVCREFEFSLPEELSQEQQVSLARNFSLDLVNRFGFAADLSIHIPIVRKPDSDLQHENAHGHLLTSTRDANGKKIRELDEKNSGAINEIRKMWEVACNDYLKKNGFSVRVSCEKLPFKNIEEREQYNARLLEKTERAITALDNAIHKARTRAANTASRRLEEDTPAFLERVEFATNDNTKTADTNREQKTTYDRSGRDARGLLTSDRPDNRQGESTDRASRRDAAGQRPAEPRDYSTSRASDGTRRREQSFQKFTDAISKLEYKLKSLQSEINIEAIKNMEQKNGNSTRKTGIEEGQIAAAVRSAAAGKKQNQQRKNQTGSQNTERRVGGPGHLAGNFSPKL